MQNAHCTADSTAQTAKPNRNRQTHAAHKSITLAVLKLLALTSYAELPSISASKYVTMWLEWAQFEWQSYFINARID